MLDSVAATEICQTEPHSKHLSTVMVSSECC